ncbi:hypothetical protein [Acanthopleuribacter pedis]|uniref:Pectate lyase superfamily protein domain-containing protein n=1 Tax=Acanthopleuribacter pedis TaxID=442870 RepID=A0A8J7QE66_9BACT|nr:hypothetical protein [Acanthopleuribacter pedis]MBO1322554.1 hypothetical protein [Acanthopleuribacter pedis]
MMNRSGVLGEIGRLFFPVSLVRVVSLCLFTFTTALQAQDRLNLADFQTGATNDIAAIQSALDALGGLPGTLYFPEGEYDLYGSLSAGDKVTFCAPNARFAFHPGARLLVGDFEYNFDVILAVDARPLFDAEGRAFGTIRVGDTNGEIYPNWFGVVADDQLPDNKGFTAALDTLRYSPHFEHCDGSQAPRRMGMRTLVIPGGQYLLDSAEIRPEDDGIALDMRPYFKPGWTIQEREKHTKGLVIVAQNALFNLKGTDFVAIQMGFHTKLNGTLSLEWDNGSGDDNTPQEIAGVGTGGGNGITGVRFGKSGDLNTGAYIENIFINDCEFGMVFTVDGCQNLRQTVNGETVTRDCDEGCETGCSEWRCNPESGVYYNHVNHARMVRCGTGLIMQTTFTCNQENGKAARVNANHFDFLDISTSVRTGIKMDWANSNSFSFLELERNGMITEDYSARGRGFLLEGQVSGLQVAGGWIEKNGWDRLNATDQEVNIEVVEGADASGLQILARMTGMYKTPSSIQGAEGLGIYTDGSTLYMPEDTHMGSVRLNEARDMRSIRSDNGLNVVLRNRRNMEVKAEGEGLKYLLSVDSSEAGHVSRGVHIPELLGETLLKPGRNPFEPTEWMPDYRLILDSDATHMLIQNEDNRLLFRMRTDSGGLYLPGNLTVDGGLNFRVGKTGHPSYRFVIREYGGDDGKDGDPIVEVDPSGMAIGQGTPIKKHMHHVAAGLSPSIEADAVHTETFTVTGAMPGDTVAVGVDGAVGGLLISGAVTGENTVTVTFFNKTGATWAPATTTVKVDVWQH